MFKKLLKFNLKYKYLCFLFVVSISILGFSRGTDLPLRLSLSALLPDDRVSVLDLKEVAKDVGGVGYLIVLIGPSENPEQYLGKVAQALKIKDINYTFYERESYSLQDKALYTLKKKEFRNLEKNAYMLLNDGKSASMLDLDLDDAETRAQNLATAKKFLQDFSNNKQVKDRYFLSKDKKYAMLLIKPSFDSEDLGRSKKLVDNAHAKIIAAIGKSVPFHFVGRYVEKVDDTERIKSDISKTALISVSLVFLLLLFGLGSLRATIATIFGILLCMGWTIGFAHITIGQINILTGFLLAILVGLGVDYGVHLIRRFYLELAMGRDIQKALEITYCQVGQALFSAALTSSLAFLILSFSDFRGFSELGTLAGLGIISIYFVYLLSFPVMIDFLNHNPRFPRIIEIFGFYPYNKKGKFPLITIFILILGGSYFAEFEYDLNRMHQLSQETEEKNKLVQSLFGRSLVPSAILASSKTDSIDIKEWMQDEYPQLLEDTVSLYDLLPLNMESRFQKLQALKTELNKYGQEKFSTESGIEADKIDRWLAQKPYTRVELPPELQNAFGSSGNIVLAYPKENLSMVEPLRRFAGMFNDLKENFPTAKIGSDVLVFVEIINLIVSEGQVVLALFILASFLVFLLDFKNFQDAFVLSIQLVCGLAVLVGLMGIVGERFSILNVAMIPAILATGIDMAVHVLHREKEGYNSMAAARFVAQAVQLSALTTIIGYGSLFFADAKILHGIAWISVLGQVSMYLVCMVIFPVLKAAFIRKENARKRYFQIFSRMKKKA